MVDVSSWLISTVTNIILSVEPINFGSTSSFIINDDNDVVNDFEGIMNSEKKSLYRVSLISKFVFPGHEPIFANFHCMGYAIREFFIVLSNLL